MKVLFPLHLFYPSKIGGPANTLYWLCKGLVKNGHEVKVVATKMGIDEGSVELDKWIDVDGINTRYCDSVSKCSSSVIKYSIKSLKDVDTVVFSSICHIPNFYIAICARLKKKKIVWSPRGELFDTAVNGNRGKKFYFLLLRVLFGKHILFHATSEAEKESILKYFPKSKVVVIPNYMELSEMQKVDSDYSDFLFVGRIAPLKALEKLIDGLSLSRFFKDSRYCFKLVGGVERQFEDYYKGLLNQVKRLGLDEKVKFIGSLTGKAKYQAYASARYSFLVSESENFGNVVIESLSQGTPVVASTGTPWDELPLNKAGFWISNAPEIIAETLDVIIGQSEEQYMKYRDGALHFSKMFDIYEHVGEWEGIL